MGQVYCFTMNMYPSYPFSPAIPIVVASTSGSFLITSSTSRMPWTSGPLYSGLETLPCLLTLSMTYEREAEKCDRFVKLSAVPYKPWTAQQDGSYRPTAMPPFRRSLFASLRYVGIFDLSASMNIKSKGGLGSSVLRLSVAGPTITLILSVTPARSKFSAAT